MLTENYNRERKGIVLSDTLRLIATLQTWSTIGKVIWGLSGGVFLEKQARRNLLTYHHTFRKLASLATAYCLFNQVGTRLYFWYSIAAVWDKRKKKTGKKNA